MILIVGGRCQGKLAFAHEIIEKKTDFACNRTKALADGALDSYEAAFEAGIIRHMEVYIRRLLEAGEDPGSFVEQLIRENQTSVVIADEIGLGIVPTEAFEREYRETAGRLCQKLAAASEEVYRVICGIGVKIKS